MNLKCLIIPVPRSISSQCGMCIETKKSNEVDIDTTLEELNIAFKKCSGYSK
ncbi:putative Se/S carrier-like protein [Shewanella sp. MEBiC00475]|uniref:putative Se/S carrier-like protein n=1 Tax=Shewanella sp. MEBiC00475 TaxID=2575361 RepID=UPI0034A0CB3A